MNSALFIPVVDAPASKLGRVLLGPQRRRRVAHVASEASRRRSLPDVSHTTVRDHSTAGQEQRRARSRFPPVRVKADARRSNEVLRHSRCRSRPVRPPPSTRHRPGARPALADLSTAHRCPTVPDPTPLFHRQSFTSAGMKRRPRCSPSTARRAAPRCAFGAEFGGDRRFRASAGSSSAWKPAGGRSGFEGACVPFCSERSTAAEDWRSTWHQGFRKWEGRFRPGGEKPDPDDGGSSARFWRQGSRGMARGHGRLNPGQHLGKIAQPVCSDEFEGRRSSSWASWR